MPGERLKLQLQKNLDSNCRAAGGLAIQKRQFPNKAGGWSWPSCVLHISRLTNKQCTAKDCGEDDKHVVSWDSL